MTATFVRARHWRGRRPGILLSGWVFVAGLPIAERFAPTGVPLSSVARAYEEASLERAESGALPSIVDLMLLRALGQPRVSGDTAASTEREAYLHVLRDALFPPLMQIVTREARNVRSFDLDTESAAERTMEARSHLRTYLHLTEPRHDEEPELVGEHREWLIRELAKRWAVLDVFASEQQRRLILADLVEALATGELASFSREDDVVKSARELLQGAPLHEIILDQALESVGCEDFRAPEPFWSGIWEFSREVRAEFTKCAWERHVTPLLRDPGNMVPDDAWVLGLPKYDSSKCDVYLRALLQERYITSYQGEWSSFLGESWGNEVQNLSDMSTQLSEMLTKPTPVLFDLFNLVYHQINIVLPNNSELPVLDPSLADAHRRRAEQCGLDGDVYTTYEEFRARPPLERFVPLWEFVGVSEWGSLDRSAPIVRWHEDLVQLGGAVDLCVRTPDRDSACKSAFETLGHVQARTEERIGLVDPLWQGRLRVWFIQPISLIERICAHPGPERLDPR